ncbi:MAG: polysaccharide deacetylase family protein [Bryobacteraceae bacterium]
MMKPFVSLPILLLVFSLYGQQQPETEVTKWQDGKQACISLTFDDSTLNQFRIAMPLLNERDLPGTFFIVTGEIQGSRHKAKFIGRPPMEIIGESRTVASNKSNIFERISLLNYLKTSQHVSEISDFNAQQLGRLIHKGNFDELGRAVDQFMAKLRESGATYTVEDKPQNDSGSTQSDVLTWDAFRRYAAQGHEFASHTVTHPYMPALDAANNIYELEKSKEDILEQMGPKHTFSVECPYGIHDERILPFVSPRYPLSRNWVTDEFMEGIMRGDSKDPGDFNKEYVQWQRGPRAKTSLETMKGWVDTTVNNGLWLVLVFHGIEGIGWEALPTETVRAYFDYIKEHEGDTWVATFQDAAKYARERVSSSVTTKRTGDVIEVSVAHKLDPKLYNLPLTARTVLPDSWNLVRFRQGSETRWVPIHREGGRTYAMYRIAPNGKPATLEKVD